MLNEVEKRIELSWRERDRFASSQENSAARVDAKRIEVIAERFSLSLVHHRFKVNSSSKACRDIQIFRTLQNSLRTFISYWEDYEFSPGDNIANIIVKEKK